MKNRNEKIQENKDSKNKQLILIPKTEQYIQYIIEVIVKIPRTEKFNIAMGKIYEIGKMLGGLIKYYGKNNKK